MHARSHRNVKSAQSVKLNPLFEALESRRLLSVSMNGTIAVITGTDSSDTVILSVDANNTANYLINDNGATQSLPQSSITEFQVNLLGGDDSFAVDEVNGGISAVRRVSGGDGNDTLGGAGSNDYLAGEGGSDLIRGGRDIDTLVGGQGNDTIIGGGGADDLWGGQGDDFVNGSGGNDLIRGNKDNDYLYGAGGNDTVRGGVGDDVVGGDKEDLFDFVDVTAQPRPSGNDSILGGQGIDTLLAHTGQDTLVGGDDGVSDLFDSRGDDDVDQDRVFPNDENPNPPYTEIKPSEQVRDQPDRTVTITLQIIVNDGGTIRQVAIPQGAGDFPGGTPVAVSIDTNGTFRLRDELPDLQVTPPFLLNTVFRQWGISFDTNHIGRYQVGNGHTLSVTVNGSPVSTFADTELADGDQITVQYT